MSDQIIRAMTEREVKAALTDHQALAATAWAEARGDLAEGGSSVEERLAVMLSVRNRVRVVGRFGDSYRAVCLRKWQYSCWNTGQDANHQAVMGLAYRMVTNQPLMDAVAEETAFLAQGVISGTILDLVGGATHYYAPAAMRPKGKVPSWVRLLGGGLLPPVAKVGRQLFFKSRPDLGQVL